MATLKFFTALRTEKARRLDANREKDKQEAALKMQLAATHLKSGMAAVKARKGSKERNPDQELFIVKQMRKAEHLYCQALKLDPSRKEENLTSMFQAGLERQSANIGLGRNVRAYNNLQSIASNIRFELRNRQLAHGSELRIKLSKQLGRAYVLSSIACSLADSRHVWGGDVFEPVMQLNKAERVYKFIGDKEGLKRVKELQAPICTKLMLPV